MLVGSATQTEQHGSLATIFLDGRVRIEDVQGVWNISPTGRMLAVDVGEIGGTDVGSHEIVIRDLDTGTTLVRAASPSMVYIPWEWSPDGKGFVFLQQEATTRDELSGDKQFPYEVRMDGGSFGAPTRVAGLAALHRQWYGESLFTTDCVGNEPVLNRRGRPALDCFEPEGSRRPLILQLGSHRIGTALNPQPVGIITPH